MRTVTTPMGETVRVIPDEEFFAPEGPRGQSMASRIICVTALWQEGACMDKSGRATKILHDRMTALGYPGSSSALNGLMASPVMSRAVKRKVKGKRAFDIRLVALPEMWLVLVQEPEQEPEPELAPEPAETSPDEPDTGVPAPAAPEAPEEPDPVQAMELRVASLVGMSLLSQVVEIVKAGTAESTDARVQQLQRNLQEVEERLGDRLGELNRLRQEKRKWQDEREGLVAERDGLRTRLRISEQNLARAMTPETGAVVNGMVATEISKIMRERPEAPPHARFAGPPPEPVRTVVRIPLDHPGAPAAPVAEPVPSGK